MKIVIEVVATNMDTGHIAISQETVETGSKLSGRQQNDYLKQLIDRFEKEGVLNPVKIGPILIKRSVIALAD